jgi:sec-independent protein translocase protein TatA
MIGDLFDSPWKIAIIVILIIVLFGQKKLPGAAKSLGQSMRILKSEVGKMHDDEPEASNEAAPVQPVGQITAPVATPPVTDQQSQIDSLQQQIRDMQRAAAMDPVSASKQDDI